jgi:hypothetical protein
MPDVEKLTNFRVLTRRPKRLKTERESGFKAHPPAFREPPLTLKLTDSQQWQVIRATNPLDMLQRDAFLAALLQQFADRTEIGDGELFRTLRELQRQHFRPPSATHLPHKFPQTAGA